MAGYFRTISNRCIAQGIALVGAGQILNFQSIQTYVIDAFTLHAASGENVEHTLRLFQLSYATLFSSARCRFLFALASWLRLPSFCARNV